MKLAGLIVLLVGSVAWGQTTQPVEIDQAAVDRAMAKIAANPTTSTTDPRVKELEATIRRLREEIAALKAEIVALKAPKSPTGASSRAIHGVTVGMSKDQVMKILGPPSAIGTIDSTGREEVFWDVGGSRTDGLCVVFRDKVVEKVTLQP